MIHRKIKIAFLILVLVIIATLLSIGLHNLISILFNVDEPFFKILSPLLFVVGIPLAIINLIIKMRKVKKENKARNNFP